MSILGTIVIYAGDSSFLLIEGILGAVSNDCIGIRETSGSALKVDETRDTSKAGRSDFGWDALELLFSRVKEWIWSGFFILMFVTPLVRWRGYLTGLMAFWEELLDRGWFEWGSSASGIWERRKELSHWRRRSTDFKFFRRIFSNVISLFLTVMCWLESRLSLFLSSDANLSTLLIELNIIRRGTRWKFFWFAFGELTLIFIHFFWRP